MPVKLKKIGNDVLVIVSLKKDAFDALKYGDVAIVNDSGKTEFVLSKGEPMLKPYAVCVDSTNCIVKTFKDKDLDVEELTRELAATNRNLKECEKLASKHFTELTKAAAEIKVTVEDENGGEQNA